MKPKLNEYRQTGAATGRLGRFALMLAFAALPLQAVEATAAANEITSDPEAIAQLKACGSLLQAQARFTVHADITSDVTFSEDTKVQVAAQGDLSVQRPDHFKVTWRSDTDEKAFAHDGKTLELANLKRQRVAATPSPGDNDTTLDFAAGKLQVVIPFSDLIFARGAYTLDEIEQAVYVGKSTVRGVACHQILAVMDDIDLQVWIDAGEQPLMRKVVLTYKTLPGSPQYSAEFSGWDFNPKFAENAFKLGLDAAVKRLEFVIPSEN